jgi:hypothetical protein
VTEVSWPPPGKVKYLGFLSVPDLVWWSLAVGCAVIGILGGSPWVGLAAGTFVAVWGRAQVGGVRVRTRARAWVRWRARADRAWSAPLRGSSPTTAPLMRGLRLSAVADTGRLVGVVRSRQASVLGGVSSFTAMFPVECDSTTFLTDSAREQQFGRWGDVLGAQCVERGSSLTAERVTWTDVHRATNPYALQADHAGWGVDGPASDDYREFLSGFGQVAADHVTVVAVTMSSSQLAVARRETGLSGSADEVLGQAVVQVAKAVRARMAGAGFRAGELYRPVDVARMVVAAGDPFEVTAGELTGKERFGLPERLGPESVAVNRDWVAIDGAYHRAFVLGWPKTLVRPEWMWRLMSLPGPNVITAVFQAVSPSRADRDREARASRQRANNMIVAARRGGAVRVADSTRESSLRADEAAVAQGHEELDVYAIVVVTARTEAALNARCAELRNVARESGKASVRELRGAHDVGWRLALPLGDRVADAKE